MIIITKELVIKALKTEPLACGKWIHDKIRTDDVTVPAPRTRAGKCRVCAVGAVLRKHGLNNDQIYRAGQELTSEGYINGDDAKKTAEHLSRKLYMHALSNEFERLSKKVRRPDKTIPKIKLDSIRMQLIRFVKKNFPDQFFISEG